MYFSKRWLVNYLIRETGKSRRSIKYHFDNGYFPGPNVDNEFWDESQVKKILGLMRARGWCE